MSVSARLEAAVAEHRLEFDCASRCAAAERSSHALARRRLRRAPRSPGCRKSPSGAAPRGVYLWGGVGRGKTLLMDAFHASLGSVRSEREHFYRFMRGVHAELAAVKGRTDPLDLAAARIARRARVLCLDEFFVADIADAMILAGLLQGLFRRGVVLVATSNTLAARALQGGSAAAALRARHRADRGARRGATISMRGWTTGCASLERAPTYLDSRAPATAVALEQRFAALAGGDVAREVTLHIEGRPLRARAVGADIAWFDFRELCEGPRSQNDYIDLARLYGTLFITDVPQFTPADEDAARRFIMLIDELYDRGVKIVVSAAAPPAQLYHGDRLRFEFERAASRLIEMQTQHYLAGSHRA